MTSVTGQRARVAAPVIGGRSPGDAGALRRVALSVMPLLVTVAVWELIVRLGIVKALFLPAFSSVLWKFWEILVTGELLSHFKITVGRMLLGYVIGAGGAVAFGLAIGLSAPLRLFFSPLIAATYPLPKIALLSLFLVIFGIGNAPIVASIVASAMYPVLLNTITGILAVDPILIRAARNLGANRFQVTTKVVLPGALPIIFGGLRMGAAVSLIVVVAVEMYIAQSGVGYLLAWATEFFKTDLLYANLMAIGIFGIVVFKALDVLERWALPWNPEK
ncbi:MAG: ABC transporter permease [Candidatus Rokubacteria bacterium]|nr:ABC transporter permease [Candidatus Rokubacteria bacterium]MBI3108947.1 ABC transporter permease [Candidatus Rokubacteria bacterium]